MDDYANASLEKRISALEGCVRRIELGTQTKPRHIGLERFEIVTSAIGFAVICVCGGLILAKLMILLIDA